MTIPNRPKPPSANQRPVTNLRSRSGASNGRTQLPQPTQHGYSQPNPNIQHHNPQQPPQPQQQPYYTQPQQQQPVYQNPQQGQPHTAMPMQPQVQRPQKVRKAKSNKGLIAAILGSSVLLVGGLTMYLNPDISYRVKSTINVTDTACALPGGTYAKDQGIVKLEKSELGNMRLVVCDPKGLVIMQDTSVKVADNIPPGEYTLYKASTKKSTLITNENIQRDIKVVQVNEVLTQSYYVVENGKIKAKGKEFTIPEGKDTVSIANVDRKISTFKEAVVINGEAFPVETQSSGPLAGKKTAALGKDFGYVFALFNPTTNEVISDISEYVLGTKPMTGLKPLGLYPDSRSVEEFNTASKQTGNRNIEVYNGSPFFKYVTQGLQNSKENGHPLHGARFIIAPPKK